MNKPRIYFDNAATSWPKSQSVIDAVWKFVTQCGATAGRGNYSSAIEADRHLANARLNLSQLIGAGDAHSIAFCSSGTHSLNAALCGVLQQGDHLIATSIEHNSVLRPLQQLVRTRRLQVDYVPCDSRGVVNVAKAAELVRSTTRWIVVGHASNVTGAVQDLCAWSELANQHGANLLVDASQTLGYLPIDVRSTNVDVMVAAGHKGLGGFAGTGFIYATPKHRQSWQPYMTGGTGQHSNLIEPASSWPEAVEVGNLNLPGIISMGVAASELMDQAKQPTVQWQTRWRELMEQLVAGLRTIPGVKVVGYEEAFVDRVPLVSIVVDDWDVHELATVLDNSFGIEVRAGFHCAALIHGLIGTLSSNGTLRISLGHFTVADDVNALIEALREIVGG